MIDRKNIGKEYPPVSIEVEKGQLKFFAKAVDEKNAVYSDESAAKAAGYASLPAPPTFGMSLGLLAKPDPFKHLIELGIDLGRLLHGEQKFEYIKPILAGDTITLQDKIVDIYDKKGGALEFMVMETTVTNQDGDIVQKQTSTTVVRN